MGVPVSTVNWWRREALAAMKMTMPDERPFLHDVCRQYPPWTLRRTDLRPSKWGNPFRSPTSAQGS